MSDRCDCRLTVLGTKPDVQRFQGSRWEQRLGARYVEPLQFSPHRFVVQFEADSRGPRRLQVLSQRSPRLVFLMDYEVTRRRRKGLIRAVAGQLEHYTIRY